MTAQQKQFKVLVIGDTCTDFYAMCKNTRLNPESSAPLVIVESTYHRPGMAGNVVHCFEQLGVSVNSILSKNGSIKRRYINAKTKEQLLRVDADFKTDPLEVEDVDNTVFSHLYDALVISDYDKGFLSYQIINYLAKIFDGPVFLDTKKKFLDNFDPRIFLKINEQEANAASVVPDNAIVTLGEKGVIWYNERWPAYKNETVDVCGAGDAFLAGMVYGYLVNEKYMLEYGIVNAGISVRHVGTYSPTLKELEEGLDDYYKQCRKDSERLGSRRNLGL